MTGLVEFTGDAGEVRIPFGALAAMPYETAVEIDRAIAQHLRDHPGLEAERFDDRVSGDVILRWRSVR